ncbi:tetranectin-like protein [Haliotis asinina]|uniref:tetranectin-like protein n=1 Tax=Haliotis asinina TaxID=109174 RepID=UPI0035326135
MSPSNGKEEMGTLYYSLSSGNCPPRYIHNRLLNVCYQLHLNKALYIEGLADCRSRGEHFIVIDSSDKQSHFVKQVTASKDSRKSSYYIDGSDAATEGQWVYHDGRPMTYFAWAPDYPDNSTVTKDYISASRTRAFRWRDRIVDQRKFYACEKDI